MVFFWSVFIIFIDLFLLVHFHFYLPFFLFLIFYSVFFSFSFFFVSMSTYFLFLIFFRLFYFFHFLHSIIELSSYFLLELVTNRIKFWSRLVFCWFKFGAQRWRRGRVNELKKCKKLNGLCGPTLCHNNPLNFPPVNSGESKNKEEKNIKIYNLFIFLYI